MNREHCHTELHDKMNRLLSGPLVHTRAAALAGLLVPLASVAAVAAPGGQCDFYSGGLAASLFDPVPDLIGGDGRRVRTNDEQLATMGRVVAGVAADGVSQVVMRISGSFGAGSGEQITVTVLRNGVNPSMSVDDDGSVGAVGAECPGTGCQSNHVTVTTKCMNGTLLAFAVYRSPTDFPRSSVNDSARVFRDVHLRLSSAFGEAGVTVRVMRPPVALIHGLWSNADAWEHFSPLLSSAMSDVRFRVAPLDYGYIPVRVISSSPPLTVDGLGKVTANSLGFTFNRGPLRQQIIALVNDFKTGVNPEGIPVASVQADVVGHSMGGTIARSMVLDAQFLSDSSFRQGVIHKLITIDTPHLGSALATRLLADDEFDGCFQHSFGNIGQAVLTTAVVASGNRSNVVNGAVGDLVDSPMSAALQDLANNNSHQLPTAMISGAYRNWAWLDSNFNISKYLIQHWPTGCPGDPLLSKLNSTDWPAIFNEDNDGIVQRTSQENGLTTSGFLDGYAHSEGTTQLGFAAPTVLAPGASPLLVIGLLNTPLTNAQFYKKINP